MALDMLTSTLRAAYASFEEAVMSLSTLPGQALSRVSGSSASGQSVEAAARSVVGPFATAAITIPVSGILWLLLNPPREGDSGWTRWPKALGVGVLASVVVTTLGFILGRGPL